jgi:hypothetical protein
MNKQATWSLKATATRESKTKDIPNYRNRQEMNLSPTGRYLTSGRLDLKLPYRHVDGKTEWSVGVALDVLGGDFAQRYPLAISNFFVYSGCGC